MNIKAVAPLIATPIAATQIIVMPTTRSGCTSRRIASQESAPVTASKMIAFASAAKIEERRNP
jgi:hypothetical protein